MAPAADTQLTTFIIRGIKITCGFELIVVLSFVKSMQTIVVTLYDVEMRTYNYHYVWQVDVFIKIFLWFYKRQR